MEQPESSESLVRRICRTLTRTDSEFALFFVLVNLPAARKELARQVIAQTARPVVELSVPKEGIGETTLDGWLLPRLENAAADSVVFLHDLDRLLPAEKKPLLHFLQQVNWRRSALAAIQRPLVIWLPRYALDNLAEYAPDFYDWYSNVYEFASQEQEIEQVTSFFITELFNTGINTAERLSREEKREWLHTLTVLLDEHPVRDARRAELLTASGRLHYAIGNLDDTFKLYKQALELRQEIGDQKGEGKLLDDIYQIYHVRGDQNTALDYLKQSLEIRRKAGDKVGKGTTLNNISQIYHAKGDYDTALDYLRQALKIQQQIGDKAGEGTTLNNISQTYHARGDYGTALDYLKQALEIQQQVGNRLGVGITLNNVSAVFKDKNDHNSALVYLKQALEIFQQLDNKSKIGGTLNNISQIYHARGDYNTALDCLKQSLEIRRKIGDKTGEGTTLNNISQIYNATGDFDSALEYLQQSLRIRQEIGDKAGLCITLFNIGHIHAQNKKNEEAVTVWVQAYLLAKKINHAEILQALEKLAEHLGMEGGLDAWEKLATRFTDKKNAVP